MNAMPDYQSSMAFAVYEPGEEAFVISVARDFSTVEPELQAHLDELEGITPVSLQERVDEITGEMEMPNVTIPTRMFARLVATIEWLGGDARGMLAGQDIVPTFSPDPDAGAPELERPAAKAMQLLAWGDNGLKAIDKQCYELVLRMTKTQPGTESDYVRVSLGAVGKRLGVSAPTASKALQGLVTAGLVDTTRKVDPITGHTHIYARAGKMPIWGERYAENKARAKDAKRKRVCESCGSPRLMVKHVCTECGTVQVEAPHYEELVDVMADLQNTEPSTESSGGPQACEAEPPKEIRSKYITTTSSTSSDLLAFNGSPSHHRNPSLARPTVKDCKLGNGWYYMAPNRTFR